MKTDTRAEQRTDTAHHHWNTQWQSEEGRADWLVPEPFVQECTALFRQLEINHILDLGCGVGRHALYLAEQGFTVSAVDGSETAVNYLSEQCRRRQVEIDVNRAEMIALPYENNSLDSVVAWNVIYHGDRAVVQAAIAEILRVLRPGGCFLGSMLSKRNSEVRTGRCIGHNTYINENSSDKDHPHFYCSGSELVALFSGFELLLLEDTEHARPGSYHWHLLAEKL